MNTIEYHFYRQLLSTLPPEQRLDRVRQTLKAKQWQAELANNWHNKQAKLQMHRDIVALEALEREHRGEPGSKIRTTVPARRRPRLGIAMHERHNLLRTGF